MDAQKKEALRVGGKQTSYRGEVAAGHRRLRKAKVGSTVHTDCEGWMNAVNGKGPVLQSREMILPMRELRIEKKLKLNWVKAHDKGKCPPNEEVDVHTHTCITLPAPRDPIPTRHGDIVHNNEFVYHPKTIFREKVHTHTGISRATWKLFHRMYKGHQVTKHLFGLLNAPLFDNHTVAWAKSKHGQNDNPKKKLCPHCNTTHLCTLQGAIGSCTCEKMATLRDTLWNLTGLRKHISEWWINADDNDRYLLARLTIPTSLKTWMRDVAGISCRLLHKGWRAMMQKGPKIISENIKVTENDPTYEKVKAILDKWKLNSKQSPWEWDKFDRSKLKDTKLLPSFRESLTLSTLAGPRCPEGLDTIAPSDTMH